MTRDDIIRMAKEAGLMTEAQWGGDWAAPLPTEDYPERIAAFAALVAAAERDRCCAIVYSQCGSDNTAQRTVDAIRREP